MTRSRLTAICAAILLPTVAIGWQLSAAFGHGQTAPAKTADSKPQSELASKTVKISTVPATAPTVKGALDAKDLAGAKAKAGKAGAFVGTVSKVYAPKNNALVILDFDPNYKTAMTAVVKSESFAKFPSLDTLEGKKVLVTGKIEEFRSGYQIVLDSPTEIKIVQ